MPTFIKTNDWAQRINGDEPHVRPHAHIGFRDGSRVSVCIPTGEVLACAVRPAARLAPALQWMAQHREELLNAYRRLKP